jgi:hypothetical protein
MEKCYRFIVDSRGFPIIEAMMYGLSSIEQLFWKKFANKAQDEINENYVRGETAPYVPSLELKTMYNMAVILYDETPCQLCQLRRIFVF